MEEKVLLQFDLIHAKIGYIIASLSSYSSLNLSKRIIDINKHIDLIKQSIIDKKEYVDIRDVIELRNFINSKYENSEEGPYDGHKIACLLYEVAIYIRLLKIDIDNLDDMKEYLELSSQYLCICAKIINEQILCY